MILTHLKFLKLFSWTFVFIFLKFLFLSLSVSQKFLTHKRMKKNQKNSKKSTFSPKLSKINKCWFFSKISLQLFDFTPKVSLVWFWYSYDNFWWFYENLKKYFFYQKKNNFFQKKHFFFKNINYGRLLYRRRNMNTSSI